MLLDVIDDVLDLSKIESGVYWGCSYRYSRCCTNAEPRLDFGSVQTERGWKPIFQPNVFSEWLALVGQFFWLCVWARGLTKKTALATNTLLYKYTNCLLD
jgi:hypothetical protein